jgi:hypothetical protein
MSVELDHVFVCVSAGAPEASELLRFGLVEGPPNQHPGQGTACRRFSFQNAMLELFWVSDEQQAQNEATRRTLLWERWSGRGAVACPFGICLRPAGRQQDGSASSSLPFPGWEYRPSYLPEPLAMYIGEAGVSEPMWIYMDFLDRAQRRKHFLRNGAGVSEITALELTTRSALDSECARVAMEDGVITARTGSEPLLEVEFDHARRKGNADFRPLLPLRFRF